MWHNSNYNPVFWLVEKRSTFSKVHLYFIADYMTGLVKADIMYIIINNIYIAQKLTYCLNSRVVHIYMPKNNSQNIWSDHLKLIHLIKKYYVDSFMRISLELGVAQWR